jgi:hypothetical protein
MLGPWPHTLRRPGESMADDDANAFAIRSERLGTLKY